jgi:hypothetical protein
MKRLFFFFWMIILLPFSIFGFSLSFEEMGEYEDNAFYSDVEVSGKYAFLVAGNRGVHIFDVSNPYFPKKISEIESMDYSYAIAVKGFCLYIADGRGGVRVFDIRDKSKPEQISFMPSDDKALDLVVFGDYCFVADGKGGLLIVDISKPFFPSEISVWKESDYVNSIEVVQDYAFFSDERGVLSLLTSGVPDSLDEYERISDLGPTRKIISDGRFLFAALNEGNLLVMDISNISHPLLQELPGKYGGVRDIFISGFYLYIVQNGRLEVLNMLVPFNPYSSGFFLTVEEVFAISVVGPFVYAACGIDGFRIFKISD